MRPLLRSSDSRKMSESGITIVTVLVVVTLVLLVAAILFPMINVVHSPYRKISSGNNQRQIVLAMLVYANDNDGLFPIRPSDRSGHPIAKPEAGKYTTISSFEFVHVATGKEMPSTVFSIPELRSFGPRPNSANPILDYGTMGSVSQWCVDAAADVHRTPGYAYDWSTPPNAIADRVVVAERTRLAHRHVIMACFADGHVGNLMIVPGRSGPTTTPEIDDSPVYDHRVPNPAANDQDIYGSDGDIGQQDMPGHGSATQAWVR
jgi:hypothetical protein